MLFKCGTVVTFLFSGLQSWLLGAGCFRVVVFVLALPLGRQNIELSSLFGFQVLKNVVVVAFGVPKVQGAVQV